MDDDIFTLKSKTKIEDEALIKLLIQNRHIPEYKCFGLKCKITSTWLGKLIPLILVRKNNIKDDLSIQNLELLCPNCYVITYGKELPKDIICEKIYCIKCKFDLSKFGNKYKDTRICKFCSLKNLSLYDDEVSSNYINTIAPETTKLMPNKKRPYTASKKEKIKSEITINMDIPFTLEELLE